MITNSLHQLIVHRFVFFVSSFNLRKPIFHEARLGNAGALSARETPDAGGSSGRARCSELKVIEFNCKCSHKVKARFRGAIRGSRENTESRVVFSILMRFDAPQT